MRTLCDAYYEEHESHYRAFLDISLIAQLLERPTGIWKAMGSTDHRPSGTQTFSLSHTRDKMNISSLSLIQYIYHVPRKYVKIKFCIVLLYDDKK